jgi:hypothetical protein
VRQQRFQGGDDLCLAFGALQDFGICGSVHAGSLRVLPAGRGEEISRPA